MTDNTNLKTNSDKEWCRNMREVLRHDATGSLLTGELIRVVLHEQAAAGVRFPGPEHLHVSLIVLVPPEAVLRVDPPRDEVGRVRQAHDLHVGVVPPEPVRHVVTVVSNAECSGARSRQHELCRLEQVEMVTETVHDISEDVFAVEVVASTWRLAGASPQVTAAVGHIYMPEVTERIL